MYLDILVLVILGFSLLFGLTNGFIVEFISTFGIFINLILSKKFAPILSDIVKGYLKTKDETYIYVISFVLAFIIIGICLHMITIFLKNKNMPIVLRILGGALSLVKGTLICIIVLTFFNIGQEHIDKLKSLGEGSVSNEYFIKMSREYDFYLPDMLQEKMEKIRNNKVIDKYLNF